MAFPAVRFFDMRKPVARRSPITVIVVGILCAGACILLHFEMDVAFRYHLTYILSFPGVLAATMIAGLWAGVVCATVSGVAAILWFQPPHALQTPSNAVGLIAYLVVSIMICAITEAQRSARATAEQRAADLRETADALRRSELRARRLTESNLIGVAFWEEDGTLFDANDAFLELTGLTRDEVEAGAAKWQEGTPENWREVERDALRQVKRHGKSTPFEKEQLRRDGVLVPVLVGAAAIHREPLRGVAFLLDLSERKRLHERLLQSQKMEAVSRLAGEVAHDFNNLLTAMSGYAELAMDDLQPSDPIYSHLTNVLKATDGAAELTRQLLAFSRRQPIEPRVIDFNELVSEVGPLLRGVVTEDIQLTTTLTPELGSVRIDPGQFHRVIMNLVVNARDAMPDGGALRLDTGGATLRSGDPRLLPEMAPGDYLTLEVADSGMGIPDSVREHLFEPFFTTKERGKGTGLGLATCYGIVTQAGGCIAVESRLGEGSTFRVLLPRAVEAPEPAAIRRPTVSLPRGTETVLLVEDQDSVRGATSKILRSLGYTVIEAHDGAHGIEVASRYPDRIDLLLTDVVMPKIGGIELAERFAATDPSASIVLMSGYADGLSDRGVTMTSATFLQKPFTTASLAHSIRETLESNDRRLAAVPAVDSPAAEPVT